MIVGLYTGRVMLQALGVDSYGINNVIGGIVGMSSLITSTMSAAIVTSPTPSVRVIKNVYVLCSPPLSTHR